MEHGVDLDAAFAVVVRREIAWRNAGLTVDAPSWRDGDAPWPAPFETDRARVRGPDSLGVRVSGPEGAEFRVVLFRGGWVDAEAWNGDPTREVVVLPAGGVTSPERYGAVLDAAARLAFGMPGTGTGAGTAG
ncbi:hypothetical protein [Streptomyces alkaliphilus]|uniref:hypothetical protein n=1 Tax=Streptomyces alkaliphilus TaxID=1472722 RepID=UPI0011814544|nr:hypothetical protein [Streptomyces alkaliphilus]MQS07255.1 hypothetical protein [Streptomyces alkaliphilus]